MMEICYIEKNFSTSTQEVIDQANDIIAEYAKQGYQLTLRQLYYQFVARDLIANQQQSYKRIGSIVADGRNAGLIDWDAIEDRTRELRALSHWDSPSELVEACSRQFRFDLWEEQDYRIEVWVEKDALVGVFEPMCQELDVALFSCRGFASQSEVWAAGRRLRGYDLAGQTPVVLHFGDHDPSGIDMTRDIRERLALYAECEVKVDRLALNFDQVDEYGPPANPAKTTDSRYQKYAKEYGEESWELDALEPAVIAGLIRDMVESYRDESLWATAVKRQLAARRQLQKLAKDMGNGSG